MIIKIETSAHILESECAVYYGDRLQHRVDVRQGEQCSATPTFRTLHLPFEEPE